MGKRRNLRQHNQNIHGKREKLYHCSDCSYKAYQKRNLILHIRRAHERGELSQCQECDKTFTQTSSLKTHINVVHLNIKPYSCPECGHMFQNRGNMERHRERGHSVQSMEKVKYHQ